MAENKGARVLFAPMLAASGAVGVALLSVSCCVLPVALMSLGLGGIGASAFLEAGRPYFVLGSVALLGVAGFLSFRAKRRLASAECGCEPVPKRRLTALFTGIFLVAGAASAWAFVAQRHSGSSSSSEAASAGSSSSDKSSRPDWSTGDAKDQSADSDASSGKPPCACHKKKQQ